MLDVPGIESGSFWDGGQRSELRSGQYCTGDTRLVMDPYNSIALVTHGWSWTRTTLKPKDECTQVGGGATVPPLYDTR
eukprot:2177833-Prymnesium_polylepis.1